MPTEEQFDVYLLNKIDLFKKEFDLRIKNKEYEYALIALINMLQYELGEFESGDVDISTSDIENLMSSLQIAKANNEDMKQWFKNTALIYEDTAPQTASVLLGTSPSGSGDGSGDGSGSGSLWVVAPFALLLLLPFFKKKR